jgi:hypothetical protein
MAKGEQRSNKEKKKPKQEKPKDTGPVSPFASKGKPAGDAKK